MSFIYCRDLDVMERYDRCGRGEQNEARLFQNAVPAQTPDHIQQQSNAVRFSLMNRERETFPSFSH